VVLSAPGRDFAFNTLVHVATDEVAPFVVSANSLDGNTIGLAFNEPIDLGTGGEASNYQVNNGNVTVVSAVIRTNIDPRTVILTLLSPVAGPFTVDVFSIYDKACNPNFGDSSTAGSVQNLTGLDIGAPLGAGSSFTATNGEIDVVAGGADIWGTSDQGHLTIGQRTGDFDVWARLDSLSRAPLDNDGITKAGIMVRETLDANARKLHFLGEPPASVGGRDIMEAGQRLTVAQATAAWTGGNGNTGVPAGIPNAWLRIKRAGNLFTAYRSSNGVDWIQTTYHEVGFSNKVYVGLAATAHLPIAGANPTGTTLAKFRNVHVPNPPAITVQPSPDNQALPLHGSVSYSVTAANPPDSGALTYQWYRNGVPVTGATTDTLNDNDLSGTDTGVYTVKVGNDGGQTESVPVSLLVNNAIIVVGSDALSATQGMVTAIPAATLTGNDNDPEAQPLSIVGVSGLYPASFASDFNSGLPAGAGVLGTAIVDATGGVADSGALKLTTAVGNQGGGLIISNLTPGKAITAFSARFKVLVTGGSANPADGFSFSLSSAPALVGEDGATAGLAVAFDNYDNGGGEAPAIDLRWNNATVATTRVPKIQGPLYFDVAIRLYTDGKIDVSFAGSNVYSGFQTPYTPISGSFVLGARTGGEYEAHSIDDLSITTVTTLETIQNGTVTLNAGTVNYTPPSQACGSDAFYYLVTDGLGDTQIAQVNVSLVETNPQPPVIVTCATNRTIVLYTNSQYTLPNLTGQVTATDTCGTPVVTQSPLAGTVFNENTTNVVTFTATDVGGLTSSCEATIIVQVVRPTFVSGSASYGGGTFSASFQTVAGVNYRVEYKDDLNALTWSLLTTIVGDGTVKTFSDPGPLPPMRYYQIVPVP
jgi:hypothetical protein